MGICLLRQMLFVFAKVCVGDFKNRSASRADTVFNLGADVGMSPMGEHIGSGLTKSRKLSVLLFRVFLLRVAYCRVDVTPFRRVQHLTIFYLERGRLTRGISCERVYTL